MKHKRRSSHSDIIAVKAVDSYYCICTNFLFLFFSSGVQRYYIASSRELTRLGSITKAPILHHFSETVSGIMTVRCFGKEDNFFQGNVDRVNANLRMDFHSNASNEWLGLRLEFIGSILICVATVFMVLLPSFVIPPGEILRSSLVRLH